ncbi:hypothetical protein MSMEG_6930 [Mycolicibacterium smegmatis MC2 155]|uniref:Uncharacterized protein n=1 Tax=Mycolicibacterium smegmatis (strain ATCC 700084 / mc(2)155) TaxID=246196 RepID=A0R7I7_MYCS2|nr:hypothetical protein MSMEG_6930 [Mycolicibacterium smegmatis MC2 155]
MKWTYGPFRRKSPGTVINASLCCAVPAEGVGPDAHFAARLRACRRLPDHRAGDRRGCGAVRAVGGHHEAGERGGPVVGQQDQDAPPACHVERACTQHADPRRVTERCQTAGPPRRVGQRAEIGRRGEHREHLRLGEAQVGGHRCGGDAAELTRGRRWFRQRGRVLQHDCPDCDGDDCCAAADDRADATPAARMSRAFGAQGRDQFGAHLRWHGWCRLGVEVGTQSGKVAPDPLERGEHVGRLGIVAHAPAHPGRGRIVEEPGLQVGQQLRGERLLDGRWSRAAVHRHQNTAACAPVWLVRGHTGS